MSDVMPVCVCVCVYVCVCVCVCLFVHAWCAHDSGAHVYFGQRRHHLGSEFVLQGGQGRELTCMLARFRGGKWREPPCLGMCVKVGVERPELLLCMTRLECMLQHA